jgi:hypothetical protein
MMRLKRMFRSRVACRNCARHFSRRAGEQVGVLYDRILADFEHRLATELKKLPVSSKAGVLVQFGMHMEDARVASVQMLLRSLAETLAPQLGGLARGHEGHLDIRRIDKGDCACCDIDALVEDGSHSRQRIRIARIESSGFIEVDLNQMERVPRRRAVEEAEEGEVGDIS